MAVLSVDSHEGLCVLSTGSRTSTVRFCMCVNWHRGGGEEPPESQRLNTVGKIKWVISALLSVAMYLFKYIYMYLKLNFPPQKLHYVILDVLPMPYPKQEHWKEKTQVGHSALKTSLFPIYSNDGQQCEMLKLRFGQYCSGTEVKAGCMPCRQGW